MGKFRVVEQYVSINEGGRFAGQLACHVRFAGCNLNCNFCDVGWINAEDTPFEEYDEDGIYRMVKKTGVKNITLTGGEPLLQEGMIDLLELFRRDHNIRVEVETNGSIDIGNFMPQNNGFAERIYNRAKESFGMTLQDMLAIESKEQTGVEEAVVEDNVSFTVDYKLSASGMEKKMFLPNYRQLRPEDSVRFVVGSREDVVKTKVLVDNYEFVKKGCGVFISPCYDKMEPAEIVQLMIKNNMNDVNLQLQTRKFIWDSETRGV
jgi:7-carboxy-7-deazaguanine synthase